MGLQYRGRITFHHQSTYWKKLKQLEKAVNDGEILKKAIYQGAGIVADKVYEKMEALPEEEFRRLRPGETFHGVPKGQKKDLLEHYGTTQIERDNYGFYHTKIGFEGFGDYPTKDYPQGIPIPLLAASIESGSSVRQKMPFIEPAVKETRKQAIEAMEKVIDEEIKKIF